MNVEESVTAKDRRKVEEIKERSVFYIKSQAAEYGFLRQGTSKVSSTIAPKSRNSFQHIHGRSM